MSNKGQSGKRASFSGKIGYVLAVAGSAVGLGNIWRFPYLAAKYGGGIFLLVYLILTVTFGYVLIMSETALGRMTRKSPVGAYQTFGKTKSFKIGGWLNAVIPMLIVPYYSSIGGWVIKYLVEYLKGNVQTVAQDGYFTEFISDSFQVEAWFIVFAVLVFCVILAGVENGVERVSKIMMPILVILAVIVAIYSVTRPGAIEGVKYFLIPNPKHFSAMTVVAAMGQMFYSLSIAMGILYTYGSYIGKDVDLEKSTTQVEIFDTAIAMLAGLMIIPAVYTFMGTEGMSAGPGLMFVSLPKVFYSMGTVGRVIGILFFVLAGFAALTSCISVLESITANCMELFHTERKKTTRVLSVIYLIATAVIALGYSVFYVEVALPNGSTGQLLDIMDYISNSFMMPFISLLSAILIGWIMKPSWIAEEMELNGKKFKRKKLYNVMMRYIMPVIMMILFLQSTGVLNLIMK